MIFEITKSEVNQAAETLHQAFADDPLMKWIFGTPEAYQQSGKALFETSIRYGLLYGMAIRTEHFEAVAVRRLPGDVHFGFWRLYRSGMSKLPKVMGKEAFDRLMLLEKVLGEKKHAMMAGEPFIFCWMLGVKPTLQGQGFGRQLMNYTFDKALQLEVPCYLEVANDQSQQIHAGQGFQKLSEVIMPGSNLKLTTMKKT